MPIVFFTDTVQKHNNPKPIISDNISWDSNYTLDWSDFQASPIQNSSLDAYTMLGISLEVVSQNNGQVDMGVFGYFEKNKSWVKQNEKTDALLKHEMKHFDLCEVYRRILVKRLESGNPYAHKTFNNKISEIFNRTFSEYTKEQEKYDHETNHSRDKVKQSKWDKSIAERLKKLENYKEIIAKIEVQ